MSQGASEKGRARTVFIVPCFHPKKLDLRLLQTTRHTTNGFDESKRSGFLEIFFIRLTMFDGGVRLIPSFSSLRVAPTRTVIARLASC